MITSFLERPVEMNILKTIEEIGELQSELIKYITKGKEGKFDLTDLSNEIADVEICLDIIKKQFHMEAWVTNIIPEKVERGIQYANQYGFRKGLRFE